MNLSSDILFYAFRYALGRMTYAVSDVANEIIRNAKEIPRADRCNMINEITEALDSDGAGMELDRQNWEKVRKVLQHLTQ